MGLKQKSPWQTRLEHIQSLGQVGPSSPIRIGRQDLDRMQRWEDDARQGRVPLEYLQPFIATVDRRSRDIACADGSDFATEVCACLMRMRTWLSQKLRLHEEAGSPIAA